MKCEKCDKETAVTSYDDEYGHICEECRTGKKGKDWVDRLKEIKSALLHKPKMQSGEVQVPEIRAV